MLELLELDWLELLKLLELCVDVELEDVPDWLDDELSVEVLELLSVLVELLDWLLSVEVDDDESVEVDELL